MNRLVQIAAALGIALLPAAGRCGWLIGSAPGEGVHPAPSVSYSDAHRAGRPYLPLYSDEWRNLRPSLRNHIVEVWREMSRRGLRPYFNDGARTTQDSMSLALVCGSGAGRCAHAPAVGPTGRHEQGLAVDMQPAGYRVDWTVFYEYAQILDANGLYLPLGGSDLPHVEQLPLDSGNGRLSFIEMFNATQLYPSGSFMPWTREYMVLEMAKGHWSAARNSQAQRAATRARVQALQRAAERQQMEASRRAMYVRDKKLIEAKANTHSSDKIWLPAACADDNCVEEEWMTPEELQQAIEDEGNGGSHD